MRERVAADKAKQKRERPVRIARKLGVVGITLGDGEMFQLIVWSVCFRLCHATAWATGSIVATRRMFAL